MANLKIGVIGLPGKWSSEVLADAVAEKTGYRLLLDMAEVKLDTESKTLTYKNIDLTQLDALIVKKISAEYSPHVLDKLELLRVAENRGVRVFSRAENILRLIDRLSCTVTLCNHDIPMPPTQVTESIDEAIKIVEQYQEAVFKPLYSTKARGMFIAKASTAATELKRQITEFSASNPMMYIQKKIELPGQDLGMVFLGNEYLGCYARVSQNSAWNTTINSGGKYANYQADDELIALAHKAQAPFNMDFTTVDVAQTPDGPVVFEVSAFGGFRGAKEGIGINAANLYVDYVVEQVLQGKQV
ncbi:GAK system ATP-grasp enzyme [Catenovulum sediminis]|uniref:GAK system ATP-grasp enzyme n=1 Tax=Catenovulum sediminis TaxID=1740262 RepID=A0ABV1RE06_9ALTE